MNHTSFTRIGSETFRLPEKRRIALGLQFFVLASTLGVLVSFWWKHPENIREVFSSIHWRIFPLVFVLVAMDYLLGGLRFRIFFNGRVLPRISLWHCMLSNWANIFMGAITPFQTGGGPAQFYVLWRKGARLPDILLASAANFIATLAVLFFSCLIALQFLPQVVGTTGGQIIFRGAFVVVGAVLAAFLVLIAFPLQMVAALKWLLRWLPTLTPRFERAKRRFTELLLQTGQQIHQNVREIFRRQAHLFALSVLLTLCLYFNKFLIGYLLATMLSPHVPFLPFLNLQIVQLFVIYFAPTPGASGLAEVSTVWLLENLLSAQSIILFAVAWRFFTTILGAIVGGIVLFIEMRRGEV